jgi:hypothetical protein
LFAYLFIVWGIAICILFLISRRLILYHRNQSSHDQR